MEDLKSKSTKLSQGRLTTKWSWRRKSPLWKIRETTTRRAFRSEPSLATPSSSSRTRNFNKAESEQGASSRSLGEIRLGRADEWNKHLEVNLKEFEEAAGVKLWWHDEVQGHPYATPLPGDEKPEEQIRIAKLAADLYYGVQLKALNDWLRTERRKRATWRIGTRKLKDSTNKVAICDVCANLTAEARLEEEADDDDFDDDGGHYGWDEGYAEDFAEPDARD